MNINTLNYAVTAITKVLETLKANVKINYQFTDNDFLVPSTGKAICKSYNKALVSGSVFYVLNTPKDSNTILGQQGNNNYRLLHDIDHATFYKSGKGTTSLNDELFLNALFAKRVFNCLRHNARFYQCDFKIALYAYCVLIIDLLEQANFYSQKGYFVEKQLDFTMGLINNEYKYIFDMMDTHPQKAIRLLNTITLPLADISI